VVVGGTHPRRDLLQVGEVFGTAVDVAQTRPDRGQRFVEQVTLVEVETRVGGEVVVGRCVEVRGQTPIRFGVPDLDLSHVCTFSRGKEDHLSIALGSMDPSQE